MAFDVLLDNKERLNILTLVSRGIILELNLAIIEKNINPMELQLKS